MSINPLNEISRVYLENIAESSHLETDMKKRHKDNEEAIEDMKKTKAHKEMSAAAKKKMEEGLDPVGQEDADIDNDGDTDKSDKYLHKRRKAIGKAIASKKGMKEGFSNWRQDLSEVISDVENNTKIKEKKINNKIKINPKLGESLEEIGVTLLEVVEVDEFDFIVESAYEELLDEGYGEDDIEEALEFALTEAKVTFGHDTPSTEKKKEGLLSLARKKLSGVKKAAKQAVATGARKVAKGALGVARKMEGGDTKPSAAHTATRKASTYRGAGVGQKEKVSSGSYKAPEKKKAETVSDPWEGSYKKSSEVKTKKTKTTAKPKPKAKAAATTKKGKGKLDDLLSSIRNEEFGMNEENKVTKLPSAINKKRASSLTKTSSSGRPALGTHDPSKGSYVGKGDIAIGSGRMGTLNPVKSLGRDYKGDKDKVSSEYKKQVKADRKAAAKERSASGEDRLSKLIKSVRNEETQLDEKTLTKREMSKREELVKSMKKRAADFEKRYPGRGKEVMYATATKMAKKIAEQMVDQPTVDTSIDKKKEMIDKSKLANLKMIQQKKQQLDRQKLQMQKSGKLPLEAD